MPPEPRHRARSSRWSTRPRRLVAALIVVALVAAGVLVGVMISRDSGPAGAAAAPNPSGVAALGPLTGPPTLFGRVQRVVDPATAIVDVQGRAITVSIIGVDVTRTPECARAGALAFARSFLDGKEVTLVPDPTLPAPAPASPTWPAYLVVPSQQSYTDAALTAGWVSAGTGRYRPGFVTGERIAQDARAGMWGPPCNRPVPGR